MPICGECAAAGCGQPVIAVGAVRLDIVRAVGGQHAGRLPVLPGSETLAACPVDADRLMPGRTTSALTLNHRIVVADQSISARPEGQPLCSAAARARPPPSPLVQHVAQTAVAAFAVVSRRQQRVVEFRGQRIWTRPPSCRCRAMRYPAIRRGAGSGTQPLPSNTSVRRPRPRRSKSQPAFGA